MSTVGAIVMLRQNAVVELESKNSHLNYRADLRGMLPQQARTVDGLLTDMQVSHLRTQLRAIRIVDWCAENARLCPKFLPIPTHHPHSHFGDGRGFYPLKNARVQFEGNSLQEC